MVTAKKQECRKRGIKVSEARIITYLRQADKPFCFARKIASKLSIDYNYINQILYAMREKHWLLAVKVENKCFYSVTKLAPGPDVLADVLK